MSNAFSKKELVAFEDWLPAFEDELVMSNLVEKYNLGDKEAEQSSDVIWRPQPYISQSFTGLDQSANFGSDTQLSVPAQVGTVTSANFTLNAVELRDGSRESKLVKSKLQKIASDINVGLMNTAAEGSIVVARSGAASGFDDVAIIDSTLNELGVPMTDRNVCYSSRDYNGLASDLAGRTLTKKSATAYERAFVDNVSNIDTYKLDYANTLTAASASGVTIAAANQFYTPKSTQASGNGYNQTNVDNRYQTISIAVTSGTVKVGDCFTIAGVNSVHHITKVDTLQPKTFRIHEIVTGSGGTGTVKISPPIISNGGSTDAEAQYQNVTATPANGAAITFLNTADARINPFWTKNAIELLPSKLVVPSNSGRGVMNYTTAQGLSVLVTKQGGIGDLGVKYRFDTYWGTVLCNPEMAGIEIFSQP